MIQAKELARNGTVGDGGGRGRGWGTQNISFTARNEMKGRSHPLRSHCFRWSVWKSVWKCEHSSGSTRDNASSHSELDTRNARESDAHSLKLQPVNYYHPASALVPLMKCYKSNRCCGPAARMASERPLERPFSAHITRHHPADSCVAGDSRA